MRLLDITDTHGSHHALDGIIKSLDTENKVAHV